VLILLPNTPQAAIAYYGTLKAGGVAVFSNQHTNQEELLAQIKDSESVIAVCLSLFYPALKAVEQNSGLRNIVVTSFKEYLGIKDRTLFRILREQQEGHRMPRTGSSQGKLYTFSGLLRRGSPTLPEPAPEVDDLAVIQYTSGTTGAPSGIMLTHKNLASNALQIRHVMPEARPGEEVILGVLPFSHSYGLTGCLNLAPVLGATLVVLPNFVSKEVLEAIARYKPTIFPGVPAMYTKLANFPGVRKYGISSIRACISGGAPLAIEVQEAFEKLTRGRLVEGYGLTEASPVTHANPISGLRKTGSIGIPLPDTEAKIVDMNTGEDVAVGVVGEMLVRGPQVMKGYWKPREDSGRTITPDGWLHTGDIGKMDEDGYFYIIEGKKDMILSGEYSVYPSDIEEVLYEHPKVLDVAVVGTKDATQSNKLKAFVVLRPGERATSEELLEICRQRLESYKIPGAVEFMEELPRNFVGKVLRRVLAEREESKSPVGTGKKE
jgi:long-chain acyl-CoA synthetase